MPAIHSERAIQHQCEIKLEIMVKEKGALRSAPFSLTMIVHFTSGDQVTVRQCALPSPHLISRNHVSYGSLSRHRVDHLDGYISGGHVIFRSDSLRYGLACWKSSGEGITHGPLVRIVLIPRTTVAHRAFTYCFIGSCFTWNAILLVVGDHYKKAEIHALLRASWQQQVVRPATVAIGV